ncbi:MAG: ABC transporter permease, partial [Euryarchaeota archaeon]
TIVLGDVTAGMLYGIIIASVILAGGTIALAYAVTAGGVVFIAVSLFLGAFCFASLGALLASPATTVPANIMMLSNLVRFLLFVPIDSTHGVARVLSYCSPITYLVDGFNLGLTRHLRVFTARRSRRSCRV